MTEPTILYVHEEDSVPLDILKRIGVERIKEPGKRNIWRYKGKEYLEPEHVINFESKVLEYFNIQIVYTTDKNQLSMFNQ